MPAEMPDRPETNAGGTGGDLGRGQQTDPARKGNTGEKVLELMEQVVCRENVVSAHARVVRNKGAPGVDGMTVDGLMPYCRKHWSRIREELLSGRYQPQPVLRVEIPKPGGGMRMLGIPTVVDRLIQQALLQVLTPIYDPGFSASSHGFRPGRGAHGAIEEARRHVEAGHRWVVDIDLEKFFDRVNHDVLMARVARRIGDKRVLRLIRRFLQAGMMCDGLVIRRDEGTPQGGPLSPLLSNILLDELDKELERRGHRFVRYADDCNIYVRSKRAGERTLASVKRFLEKRLRLRVNEKKSAVDRTQRRQFLGYTISSGAKPKLWLSRKARERLRAKLRLFFRRARGRAVDQSIDDLNVMLRGWVAYYRLVEAPTPLKTLSQWIRRKLRCVIWRQWKTERTRYRRLCALGMDTRHAYFLAYGNSGPWRSSGSRTLSYALPNRLFGRLGLIDLYQEHQRLQRTR